MEEVRDALGNLITVWEPHPVGPGAEYVTSYTYTLLGKLNVVTMTRPGKGVGSPPTVTQTRTYAYNSYGELQSVTHPENGTTQYEYFDDGSLKKKTDAKGQRLEWTYDAEGRPLMVKRFSSLGVEDVCARVTTTYGSQGLDGSFSGANLAGRLASVTTGCANVPSGESETKGGRVDELYSYNSAGAVVTKRVRILRGNSTVTKDIGYTFDGEGKLATMQYPDEAKPYVMSYDAMARPSGMTQEYQLPGDPTWLNRNWVSTVSYGVAGQLLGMSWYGGGSSTFGETRTYNERLQLTRQQATGMDLEYVFTDPQNPINDGRIIARINRTDAMNPETVKYKYDELNRLIEAEQTTGPGVPTSWWGMTWDFDGFGNRWSQDQKAQRVGIPSSVTFDLATNRVNSLLYAHDANGNMTAMPGVSGALIYDVDNRLTKVDRNGSHEQYRYLGDNKRYWKRTNQGGSIAEEYYLYGVGGQRIATYPASYNEQTSVLTVDAVNKKLDVYFGGRVIWQNGKAIVQDRLGSVMARGNGSGGVESHDYYPYGEERVATVGDRNKFGTYHRDQTGLDYADQRYYNSAIGRFLTSDPYEASGGAAEPGSWGRGGYVGGDPANYNDPRGLQACPSPTNNSITVCEPSDPIAPICHIDGHAIYSAELCVLLGVPTGGSNGGDGTLFASEGGQLVVNGNETWKNLQEGKHNRKIVETTRHIRQMLIDGDPDCANWLFKASSGAPSGFEATTISMLANSFSAEFLGLVVGDGFASNGQSIAAQVNTNPYIQNVGSTVASIFISNNVINGNIGPIRTTTNPVLQQIATPGSQAYLATVILHEAAHFFGASGFATNDGATSIQTANNDLLWSKCRKTILGVPGYGNVY